MTRYQVQHDLHKGWHLKRRFVSLHLNILAYGHIFDEDQVRGFIQASNDFRKMVAQIDPRFNELVVEHPLETGFTAINTDFAEAHNDVAYKYVSEKTLNYMLNGSFRLGTADYYRSTTNEDIRDGKEGMGVIHLSEEEKQIHLELRTGNDAYIFCCTKEIGPRDLMHRRFGARLIRIKELKKFAALVARSIGAKDHKIYDVVYNDLKNYKIESTNIYRFKHLFYDGDKVVPLSKKIIEKANRELFHFFHDVGRLPCLFTKPSYYKSEAERRLVFEFNRDVPYPTKSFIDKALISFIDVL